MFGRKKKIKFKVELSEAEALLAVMQMTNSTTFRDMKSNITFLIAVSEHQASL